MILFKLVAKALLNLRKEEEANASLLSTYSLHYFKKILINL